MQTRLEMNRQLFPASHGMIIRQNEILSELTTLTRNIRSIEQASEARPEIVRLAQNLARLCMKYEVALISQEDILGPVPTRGNVKGLYPYITEVLPSVLDGFASAGVVVEVAIYRRNYRDWLGSVFRYRFMDRSDRVFHPKRFIANNELPQNWKEFMGRLRISVGETPLHVFSFERDREDGNLGGSLCSLFGLEKELQNSFAPTEAMNVTRLATVDPNLGDD